MNLDSSEEENKNNDNIDSTNNSNVEKDNKNNKNNETNYDNIAQKGYESFDAAKKAAVNALKNDKINNAYNIQEGADGKYYYVLRIDDKTDKDKKDNKVAAKKDAKKDVKKDTNKDTKKDVKNKNKLPKAGSANEVITLAAASLTTISGGHLIKKRRK